MLGNCSITHGLDGWMDAIVSIKQTYLKLLLYKLSAKVGNKAESFSLQTRRSVNILNRKKKKKKRCPINLHGCLCEFWWDREHAVNLGVQPLQALDAGQTD